MVKDTTNTNREKPVHIPPSASAMPCGGMMLKVDPKELKPGKANPQSPSPMSLFAPGTADIPGGARASCPKPAGCKRRETDRGRIGGSGGRDRGLDSWPELICRLTCLSLLLWTVHLIPVLLPARPALPTGHHT
jgi:hypothetical protein